MSAKLILQLALAGTMLTSIAEAGARTDKPLARPEGSCDVYAAAGTPCVAAHSTTRALYAAYSGPLYQVLRQSDGKTRDIGVVQPSAKDGGGYADAAAQDAFCANTVCWISVLYDQSGKHNDLIQAPRGTFSGPAMGGFNNLPIATMAPVTVMGHKVYGVFIAPGMGLRLNDAKGTAVDDQAEGQYWVIDGHHFNAGCCFDYGNAETDSRDDGNGTMETTYYGNSTGWFHGTLPGPWVMTDQENNLVGCVNEDESKHCVGLPNITWRFVTAMAKGEPHHWASLGGDAQKGALQVMFDGRRVDSTYDPMRKQGAILLGNGGDNSNASQGTFYEGAMTAAGTFPSNAVDQKVQANVVAAGYGLPLVAIAPAGLTATLPGLQTFVPGSPQDTTVTFTNSTGAPVSGVTLAVTAPAGWRVGLAGDAKTSKFAGPIPPGASVSASFRIMPDRRVVNGELIGKASWKDNGINRTEIAVEKVRAVEPVKINEFRISDGSDNTSNAFIELYNPGSQPIDLSNWSLTQHPAELPAFSSVAIPANTQLAPHGFYVLGLANSGLAVPAGAGEATIHIRSTDGLKVGDTISIGTGADAETRKITAIGMAATASTTLWQPVPDGPVITIPAGSTNVPVTRTTGFAVGQKIALGYGASYPVVGLGQEKYEIATVTAVGKPGTQAYLGADAPAGATRIEVHADAPIGWPGKDVTAIDDISPGDTIRLDIDSVGHGIETVTVKSVGTATKYTVLGSEVAAGDTTIKVISAYGWPNSIRLNFKVGDKIVFGTPASRESLEIAAVKVVDARMTALTFVKPAATAHGAGEDVAIPGTGLELTAPLKFNHAANMPFSVRGTGISFKPASAHPHASNEPVQPLGTGIRLDTPLGKNHGIDAAVRVPGIASAGFQGMPNQWFGGPALSASGGNMVLRNASGLIVDSLNYGYAVDPWLSEGYQAISGHDVEGCMVAAPGRSDEWKSSTIIADASAGRLPDGHDADSNCSDFRVPSASTLASGSVAGATAVKVLSVKRFAAGQTLLIDRGANQEAAVIATVGTPGASTATAASLAGAKEIIVADRRAFATGQAITIDAGATYETAVVADIRFHDGAFRVLLAAPLKHAHAAGVQVSGTGLILQAPLKLAHPSGSQVTTDLPTPGAPNRYSVVRQ